MTTGRAFLAAFISDPISGPFLTTRDIVDVLRQRDLSITIAVHCRHEMIKLLRCWCFSTHLQCEELLNFSILQRTTAINIKRFKFLLNDIQLGWRQGRFDCFLFPCGRLSRSRRGNPTFTAAAFCALRKLEDMLATLRAFTKLLLVGTTLTTTTFGALPKLPMACPAF